MKAALHEANKMLPQNVALGITITDTRTAGDDVIFICNCDEDYRNMDLIKENRVSAKESIMEELTNLNIQ